MQGFIYDNKLNIYMLLDNFKLYPIVVLIGY